MTFSKENLKLILIAVFVACTHAETIGVSDGKMGDNLPSEEEVVTLLKKNNIGKYKIYKPEPTLFKAFANSGIEITVGIENVDLESFALSQDKANRWVAKNIVAFSPGTTFKYIAVGNQPFDNPGNEQFLLDAMSNIQTALEDVNLEKNIKVSTTHTIQVIADNTSPPSKATFRDSIKDSMSSLLQFLQEHDSPFMANVYPYPSVLNGNHALDEALFDSTSSVMTDGNLVYRNLFDVMVDRFYCAVEDLGYSTIPIVISESGWPSKGNEFATIANARTYNDNLIKHVLSKTGTPRRPGSSIETYIFSLFNENLRKEDETERNYGLFYPTLEPVYPVNLSPEFSYSSPFPLNFRPRVTLLLYIDT